MHSIRVGGFQPPGQKQTAACLTVFSSNSGSLFVQRDNPIPQKRVQGNHSPGGVRGKAPQGSPRQIPICNSCVSPESGVMLGPPRPQTPRQGHDAPGPSHGEFLCVCFPKRRRRLLWGYEKHWGRFFAFSDCVLYCFLGKGVWGKTALWLPKSGFPPEYLQSFFNPSRSRRDNRS